MVVFALVHLSGDPVLLMVSPDAPPEVVTSTRQALGFDRPLYEQLARAMNPANLVPGAAAAGAAPKARA